MMQWYKEDIEQYLNAKEYVDTVIILLQPFHLSHDKELLKDSFLRQALSIYANEIEQELSGRVFLTPEYNYLKSSQLENEVTRINNWVQDIKKQPFQSVFYLTFDIAWRKVESDLNGELIWLPGISSGDLQAKETVSMIQNQVTQISELIKSYW